MLSPWVMQPGKSGNAFINVFPIKHFLITPGSAGDRGVHFQAGKNYYIVEVNHIN